MISIQSMTLDDPTTSVPLGTAVVQRSVMWGILPQIETTYVGHDIEWRDAGGRKAGFRTARLLRDAWRSELSLSRPAFHIAEITLDNPSAAIPLGRAVVTFEPKPTDGRPAYTKAYLGRFGHWVDDNSSPAWGTLSEALQLRWLEACFADCDASKITAGKIDASKLAGGKITDESVRKFFSEFSG